MKSTFVLLILFELEIGLCLNEELEAEDDDVVEDKDLEDVDKDLMSIRLFSSLWCCCLVSIMLNWSS
jgi:hypothetical protein